MTVFNVRLSTRAEIQFADFIPGAMDALTQQVAAIRVLRVFRRLHSRRSFNFDQLWLRCLRQVNLQNTLLQTCCGVLRINSGRQRNLT